MKYAVAVAVVLMLSGCAGMNRSEQRMVSGAAMGGVVAGPLGAAVGAGAGYVYDRTRQDY